MNENQKSQKDTARAEVSLWSIVGLLLRKIHWLIAAGLACGIGVYLVLSLLVTPTFESRVTFYVYNNSGGASQSGSIDKSDLQAAESLATTYAREYRKYILLPNHHILCVWNRISSIDSTANCNISKYIAVYHR